MRIFMDAPERFAPLGPPLPGTPGPGPAEEGLWAALAGGAPAAAAPGPAGLSGAFWRLGCLVAEAGGSQYDALRDLAARGGLPDGHLFCLAGGGRGFHGQQGRAWTALPGNLHLCAALAADLPVPGWGPVLPALPAVAALDAVRAHADPTRPAGLKWVNDVLLDGAKVGGVLTAVRARDGRIERVFLGIGLNVAAAPDLPPDPCVAAAACLAAPGGAAPDLGAVAVSLLDALRVRWEALLEQGPASLLAAYRAGSVVVGRRVVVHPDHPGQAPRDGTATGIGDDLALHLDDGGPPLAHGRIVLVAG